MQLARETPSRPSVRTVEILRQLAPSVERWISCSGSETSAGQKRAAVVATLAACQQHATTAAAGRQQQSHSMAGRGRRGRAAHHADADEPATGTAQLHPARVAARAHRHAGHVATARAPGAARAAAAGRCCSIARRRAGQQQLQQQGWAHCWD